MMYYFYCAGPSEGTILTHEASTTSNSLDVWFLYTKDKILVLFFACSALVGYKIINDKEEKLYVILPDDIKTQEIQPDITNVQNSTEPNENIKNTESTTN